MNVLIPSVACVTMGRTVRHVFHIERDTSITVKCKDSRSRMRWGIEREKLTYKSKRG